MDNVVSDPVKSKILITCPKAIPHLLAREVKALGLPVIRQLTAGVETEGTLVDCMRLNLWLRTGHRVLFLLRPFRADGPNDLYAELSKIPWEDFIAADGYVSVSSSVENPTIRDTRFANLKCKDAIVDRISARRGRRPDSGSATDRTAVFLYWKNSECAVYFDTSGDSLSRRGYRKIPLQAPMQETLAASVILATGWNGEGNFVNPMCGSGTLAIEAALIALNRAPGLLRENFAFMHLLGFDAVAWKTLRTEARAVARPSSPGKIIATDIAAGAVRASRQNAQLAGVESVIEFRECDFTASQIPEGGGVVVLNPEYGERMGDVRALGPVYWRIGEFFKKRCKGYTGYVFTGNPDLVTKIALKPNRKIPFFNSNIECRLLEYELY